MTEFEKLNKLIEMLKRDRNWYEVQKDVALDYDSSDALMTYYLTILAYIDSLIARIKEELE